MAAPEARYLHGLQTHGQVPCPTFQENRRKERYASVLVRIDEQIFLPLAIGRANIGLGNDQNPELGFDDFRFGSSRAIQSQAGGEFAAIEVIEDGREVPAQHRYQLFGNWNESEAGHSDEGGAVFL